MHIALIGTRGVPARYGGFETAVEEVGRRLVARGHKVLVFCRPVDGKVARSEYLGMDLVQLPCLKIRQLETLSHTALSVLHPRLREMDGVIVFNAANAPLLPVLRARRLPIATHVDGLEWRRTKWGKRGRRYYRWAESMAVKLSDVLIADAQGIADYYADRFGAATSLIAYGAPIITAADSSRIAELGLGSGEYHLVVARFEPENHVLEIVRGYVASRAKWPLVVVGSAPYSDSYTAAIREASDGRVRLLGGLWDQDQLDQLYRHALTYLHGHSVGGTNPSLLRAAGASAFVIAYDVDFNHEVVGEFGEYFATPEDVARLVEAAEQDHEVCRSRGRAGQEAIKRYNWDDVTDSYEQLVFELSEGKRPALLLPGSRASS